MARRLAESVRVRINARWKGPGVYTEAKVRMNDGAWGRARITNEHDRIVLVDSNGGCLFKGESGKIGSLKKQVAFKSLALDDLIDFVSNPPDEIRRIVREGIELVKNLSAEGLRKPLGMGVGYTLRKGDDGMKTSIKFRTASAIDARMFGSYRPSMAVAGSGNQGIIATMPIFVYAEKNRMDEELLIRSVTLSYLVTIFSTYHSRYLSAVCGLASKAGIGSSAGLAYYMGKGDKKVVKDAIQNFIANTIGVVCDGGKYSCALKGASSSDAIYQSALIAFHNRGPPFSSGIIGKTADESIRNLGDIFQATNDVNAAVVKILSKKYSRKAH